MGFFKNLKLGMKLSAAFAAIVLVFVVSSWYLLQGMQDLRALQATAADRAGDASVVQSVDSHLEHLSVLFGDFIISRDLIKSRQTYDAFKPELIRDVDRLRELADTEQEQAQAAEVSENAKAYLELFEQDLFPYLAEFEADRIKSVALVNRAAALREAAMAPLDAMLESLSQERTRAQETFTRISAETRRNALGSTAGAAVLALVLAVLVTLAITRPLKRATAFALDVAQGRIEHDLAVRQKDEVGAMADALERIVRSVREVSGRFQRVADDVAVGKLRVRGETEGLDGAYAQLVRDANDMMDEVVGYMDAVPLPLMAIDANYEVLFMNKSGAELGGKGVADFARTNCFNYFQTGDCRSERCACAQAMKRNDAAKAETDAHPAGLDLEIKYSAVPIRDRKGAVSGAFEVVVDQTDIVRAQKKMQAVANQAAEISQSVSSAAEELSAQVEQSSRGADLQRERTAETATAMEEMNATVMEVARNASDAAGSADGAKQQAEGGATVVAQVGEAIHEVQRLAEALRTNMEDLGRHAEGIGAVMGVITDIADQTNLLALNAAIEAARAGDAGRGFAVVADEVRKLAEKTMQATGEVGKAVSAIQGVAKSAIESTGQAFEAVSQSTGYAEQSGKALTEIVGMVERSSDQVRAIAAASEEQSAAAEEITKATEDINRISTETAEAMVQSAQAVGELARLAQELDRLIGELRG
ncbi:MAG: methyl-accepting chemotaxis protein [Desulfovibrionaceae bacterium]